MAGCGLLVRDCHLRDCLVLHGRLGLPFIRDVGQMTGQLAGEQDEVKVERTVALPDPDDTSRPKPIQVLLVGGPMDAQKITAPVEATHVSYWVWKTPKPGIPPKEKWNTDETMQVRYQIHPLIGNTETWYIGRLLGTRFDAAINQIMEHYHSKAKR